MKTSGLRRWIALIVLGCTIAQSSAGASVLAGAAAHALLAGDHFHAFSVVAEDGHLDVILSHRPGRDHSGEDALAFREGDHVFHLSDGEPLSSSARRSELAPPALAVSAALAPPPPTAPPGAFHGRSELRAHRPDLLRTVVLRL